MSRKVLTLVSGAALIGGTSLTAFITDDPDAVTGTITVGDVFEIAASTTPRIYTFSLAGATSTKKNENGQATKSQGLDRSARGGRYLRSDHGTEGEHVPREH